MKRNLLSLLGLFLIISFSSCSKDNDEEINGEGFVTVPARTISGQMKKLLYYPAGMEDDNGNLVKQYHECEFVDYDLGAGTLEVAMMSMVDYPIATGSVNAAGVLSLQFNTEVPRSQLTEIYQFSGATVTPSNLKATWPLTRIVLTLSSGTPSTRELRIEELPVYNDVEGLFEDVYYEFLCVDRDGTITGVNTAGVSLNLNLKKGWNVIKVTDKTDDRSAVIVNSFPAEAFFHYGMVVQH